MTRVDLHGSWRVTVVRKDSDWAQRVVVSGAANTVIPGTVGAAATVNGDFWGLTVEHDPGGGWRPSAYVAADPVREHDGHATRTVKSKDHYWRGDGDPNDLVLRLEHVGLGFAVLGMPGVVDDDRFLAVTVRNTGFRAFGFDTVFDVTDAGRDTLARWGMVLGEDWEPEALRATGQEAYGRAVGVRPLAPGDQDVLRFPLILGRAGSAPEEADVEFVLTGDRTRRVRHRVRAADLRRPSRPPAPVIDVNLARPRTALPECGPVQCAAGTARASGAVGQGC